MGLLEVGGGVGQISPAPSRMTWSLHDTRPRWVEGAALVWEAGQILFQDPPISAGQIRIFTVEKNQIGKRIRRHVLRGCA